MKRNAFTLIELLVVVAIIAVLISILLPALGRAKKQARATVCGSHLHQIGTAIYTYWTEWNGRIPYVETPMVNGNGAQLPGFARPEVPDEELNPFDREKWPISLPNVLMPTYVGEMAEIFVCPAATVGWPRFGGRFRYTYRPAGANQPNGFVLPVDDYLHEAFGFMDGRVLKKFKMKLDGDPMNDGQQEAISRGTFLRDLVKSEGDVLVGPHRSGINVINRDMQVEFRDQEQMHKDLAPNNVRVKF